MKGSRDRGATTPLHSTRTACSMAIDPQRRMQADQMTRATDHPDSDGSARPKWASVTLNRIFPFLAWFRGYSLHHVKADFVSGLTVALVLIPQSMAYAQLADLPAHYGLYAAFLPPLVAALFGSSHQLATGPVAIVSLMTSTALAPLATAGSDAFIAYAILLSVLVGLFQLFLGILRLGMVVNFLSHPVINGFTNAAAVIIATSQLPKLFGVDVDKAEHHYETVALTIRAAWHHTHWPTLALGAVAFLIMLGLRKLNPRIPNVLIAVLVTTLIAWFTGFERNQTAILAQIESPRVQHTVAAYNETLDNVETTIGQKIEIGGRLLAAVQAHGTHSLEAIDLHAEESRLAVRVERLRQRMALLRADLHEFRFAGVRGPDGDVRFFLRGVALPQGEPLGSHWRIKVGGGAVQTDALTLMGGGAVVGTIPAGLPHLSAPRIDTSIAIRLLTMAVIISLLGFMEAISIAKALAAQTGQRLDPNQELIGQGLGNIVGAFSQSYPVSGSFSRSAVNYQAGALTGLSSAFSSLVVLVTLLFFTPLLYHMPQSVLAAIIMMAVIGLLNISGFVHAWKAQKYDGLISVISFVATLGFAPHLDRGIMLGVVLSLGLYLYRNMKPQLAILSKTLRGDYRDAEEWQLNTCRHVAVLRFNGSLFFASVNYLEEGVLDAVSSMPELKHVLIVGNGMNELDASGEVLLSQLVTRLRQRGLEISFSGLNDRVLDVMKRTHLFEKIGETRFFHSVSHAVQKIHGGACIASADHRCPLVQPKFKALEIDPSIRRKFEEKWKPPGK
jgi:SulP family sulfate permease